MAGTFYRYIAAAERYLRMKIILLKYFNDIDNYEYM